MLLTYQAAMFLEYFSRCIPEFDCTTKKRPFQDSFFLSLRLFLFYWQRSPLTLVSYLSPKLKFILAKWRGHFLTSRCSIIDNFFAVFVAQRISDNLYTQRGNFLVKINYKADETVYIF